MSMPLRGGRECAFWDVWVTSEHCSAATFNVQSNLSKPCPYKIPAAMRTYAAMRSDKVQFYLTRLRLMYSRRARPFPTAAFAVLLSYHLASYVNQNAMDPQSPRY